MNEPLISVIIPVYNVEKYLDRCISSIVNQTYKNLEIILVDDGSPDNCPKICDEWKNKDNRIVVLHQENKGSGTARNSALSIANGDLISFIDSDDYISPYMYERMISIFYAYKKVDIVECEYNIVKDDEAKFTLTKDNINIFSREEALLKNIQDLMFKQVVWNKLYKRKIIDSIRFPENKKIDDEFFTYKVLANAHSLIHLNDKLYAYRIQNDSVMHSINLSQKIQSIEAKVERQEFLNEKFPNLQDEGLYNLFFSCYYIGQLYLKEKPNNYKNTIMMLQKIIDKYSFNDFDQYDIKQKIWLFLGKKSLKFTCILRNILKIGF